MSHALREEQVPGQDDPNKRRDVLALHPAIAPIKAAIMPLKRNDERLVNMAKGIFNDLRYRFDVQYDDTGAIGKTLPSSGRRRYPFCITVDFDSLADGEAPGTVTVRDRDTLEQARVKIEDLAGFIGPKVDMATLLAEAGK
jgi:glycyl-tRNA synthetase